MADNNIKTICVRLNLNKPLHKKAYNFLKHMNKSEFPSNSQAIATAVSEYFDKQDYDAKLLVKLIDIIEETMKEWYAKFLNVKPENINFNNLSNKPNTEAEIDFDFLGG